MRQNQIYTFLAGCILLTLVGVATKVKQEEQSWIRINLLGYKPGSVKVAVWGS